MILTEKRQRALERVCAANGLGEAQLMESAGNAAGDAVFAAVGADAPVAVVCGSGGNGGDGIVCAMKLVSLGARPVIILSGKTPKGDAAVFYKAALRLAIPVLDFISEPKQALETVSSAAAVVDAVYGIGFRDSVPKELAALFSAVNAAPCKRFSLDLPSGVFADSGASDPLCVRADETIAFIAKKPAHIIKNSAQYCGETVVAGLGVPQSAYEQINDAYYEITRELCARLLPVRDVNAHKGSYGRVLCVVGSEQYRGAAVLCARGAVRGGAGIVEVASCASALNAVAANISEPILHDIFGSDISLFVEKLGRATAVVLGCGLSESEDAQQLVKLTLLGAKSPVVVDADGIRALSADIQLIKETAAPLVLTPHLGEFSALTGISVQKIAADRFETARAFARANGCVLVLKSETTVVAGPQGELFILPLGNPGMAKGGSGDLLAGLCGAYCGMGIAPLYAAVLAAYVHSKAADLAVCDINEYALTATDVAGYIARALDSLRK